MLIILCTITVAYLLLIGSFVYGFDKVSEFTVEDVAAKTKFSIVIPFRNESNNLPDLLASISELNYPKQLFEIIFVDDASTDTSVDIINAFNLKGFNCVVINNVRHTNAPKKDAISAAILHSKHEWIITTDADCILPKFWLDVFDDYIQKHNNAKLLIAPVTLQSEQSLFKRFQHLDILSLQGVTIGSYGIGKPFLCNGANLAYRKTIFKALEGFEGNSHIASGDDIFLLEKMVKTNKNGIHYIKNNAITVTTTPERSFKNLKSQRIRWASKTSNYHNLFSKVTAIIVLFMNGLLVCLPILCLAQIVALKYALYVFAIKLLIDFLLLFKSARFFEQEQVLSSYIWSCIIYPFFSVYVAFISIFSRYKWKDRTYKK